MTPYYGPDNGITIYNADAREALPTLDDASVDFIFTDPPYGHNNNNGDLIHRREAALALAREVQAVAKNRNRLKTASARRSIPPCPDAFCGCNGMLHLAKKDR